MLPALPIAGGQQHRQADNQQGARRKRAELENEQRCEAVGKQDFTPPHEQQRVRQPEQRQPQVAAVIGVGDGNRAIGLHRPRCHDQHARAEQQFEHAALGACEHHALDPGCHLVCGGPAGDIGPDDAEVAHVRDVHQQDQQDGEPAQHIEHRYAIARCDLSDLFGHALPQATVSTSYSALGVMTNKGLPRRDGCDHRAGDRGRRHPGGVAGEQLEPGPAGTRPRRRLLPAHPGGPGRGSPERRRNARFLENGVGLLPGKPALALPTGGRRGARFLSALGIIAGELALLDVHAWRQLHRARRRPQGRGEPRG